MAASLKQIEANRRNAKKSTGPKTERGKDASRANATTHGLTAAATIYRPIRHEDPADFHTVRGALITDWNPVGTAELLAIEMMAGAYKRIQRAEAMEAAYFDGGMEAMQRTAGLPLRAVKEADDLGCGLVMGQTRHRLTWDNLDRYRRNAWLDYNRALEQMRRLQRDRLESTPPEEMLEVPEKGRVQRLTPVLSTNMASFCLHGSDHIQRIPHRSAKRVTTGREAVEARHEAADKDKTR